MARRYTPESWLSCPDAATGTPTARYQIVDERVHVGPVVLNVPLEYLGIGGLGGSEWLLFRDAGKGEGGQISRMQRMTAKRAAIVH